MDESQNPLQLLGGAACPQTKEAPSSDQLSQVRRQNAAWGWQQAQHAARRLLKLGFVASVSCIVPAHRRLPSTRCNHKAWVFTPSLQQLEAHHLRRTLTPPGQHLERRQQWSQGRQGCRRSQRRGQRAGAVQRGHRGEMRAGGRGGGGRRRAPAGRGRGREPRQARRERSGRRIWAEALQPSVQICKKCESACDTITQLTYISERTDPSVKTARQT